MSSSAYPTIVSTTLLANDEASVGDAITSAVTWVHRVLVIDTGSTDRSVDIARGIAGEKLIVRRFPWSDDFAAARNFALDAAADAGAAWALTLDTDERIELRSDDLAGALNHPDARVVLMPSAGSGYLKERFFRLPSANGERWRGATHEVFPTPQLSVALLSRARFHELPKSAAQLRAKHARDVEALTRMIAEEPREGRWFYYLGDALQNLAHFEEAIAAYARCIALRTWDEESAWAAYRTGECLLALGRPDDAVDVCALGLARHAGVGELAWLAGFAAWKANRAEQAVFWSRIAVASGCFSGHGDSVFRSGFRHPGALYEGPFDVLRFALAQVGDAAGAREAERLYHAATLARIARFA